MSASHQDDETGRTGGARNEAPAPPPDRPISVSASLLAAAGGAQPVMPDFARIKAELDAASPKAAALAREMARERIAARLHEDVVKARHAAEANPAEVTAQFALARALREAGDRAGAVAAFRRCLEIDPNALAARYYLSALGAEAVPPKAPPPLVAGLFDFYAARFETDLVQNLKYQGPRLLHDAVLGVLGTPARPLDILDIGCGTGLCGVAFRPLARRLDGIDLSPRMLALASEKGIYTTLTQGEIAATLAGLAPTYDLVIAGDVVIYIGDLAPLCAAVARALRPGGLFALTTEKGDGEGYALVSSGHYRHGPGYVRAVAARTGFVVRHASDCVIRFEKGDGTAGESYVLAKT